MEAILAAISLADGIVLAYKGIQGILNLPEAFKAVEQKVPLVKETLVAANKALKRKTISDNGVLEAIKRCESNLRTLRNILKKIEEMKSSYDTSKDSQDKFSELYKAALLSLGKLTKAHLVENLMREIMKDLKDLATYSTFNLSDQLKRLEDAITDLSKVKQSLPDSAFAEGAGLNTTQNIGQGGTGYQPNHFGSGLQKNIWGGTNYDSGGGTMNFVLRHEERYSNIPFTQTTRFVGRREVLREIHVNFETRPANSSLPIVLVLYGIGGRGKSRVAKEYCRERYNRGYRGVFWINARTEETTIQSLQEITERMTESAYGGTTLRQSFTWKTIGDEIASWNSPWLMVFDNHDDPTRFPNLASFFPRGTTGSILVTTRWHESLGEGPSWKRMQVPDLTENEALALLPMPNRPTKEDLEAGKSIVNMLGRLPLAVVSTSGQISSLGLGPKEYLLKFKEYQYAREDNQVHGDEEDRNWDTTYEYSLELLSSEQKEVAVLLLTISAFLGEATIHEDFFKQYNATLGPGPRLSCLSYFHVNESGEWSPLRFRNLAINLGKQGLIQPCQNLMSQSAKASMPVPVDDDISIHADTDAPVLRGGVSYSLHPVIREWLRRRPQRPPSAVSGAVTIMSTFVRTVGIDAMSLQTRLDVLTHLDALVGDSSVRLNDGSGLEVSLAFSSFYRKFSRLRTAKKLLDDLLQDRAKAGIPPSDPRSVEILLEKAQTSADNAEHETAEREFTEVLAYLSSPGTAETRPDLQCQALLGRATALCAASRFKEAHPLVEEAHDLAAKANDRGALAIRAKLMQAVICGGLGYLPIANKMIQEAHEEAYTKLGKTDNLTLEINIMKAGDFAARHEFAKAKRILVETIRDLERQNGEHHRLVLNAVLQLGMLCGSAPQHDMARTYFQLAKSRAGILFGDTPGDVDVDILIGFTHMHEGDHDAAERHFEAAVEASKNRRGFELVLTRAMIALLHIYVAQWRIRKVVPLLNYFFKYFPFVYFFRTNRIKVTIAASLLLCFLYSLKAHLGAILVILLVVAAISQIALR